MAGLSKALFTTPSQPAAKAAQPYIKNSRNKEANQLLVIRHLL